MNQRFKFTSPTSTVRRYFIGLPSAPSLPTDAAPSSLSVSPELFLPTRKRAQERGRHGGTGAPPPPPRPLSLSLAYSSSSSLSLPRLSPSPPHLSISQSLSSDVVDPRDGWPPVRQHADVGRAPAIAAAPFLYPRSSPHPLPLPSLYPWRRDGGPCAAAAGVTAPPMRASTLSTIPSSLDLDTPAWVGPATAAAHTQVLISLPLSQFLVFFKLDIASATK